MALEQENNITEQFSRAEHFVRENRKSLLVIGGTIVALILLYVGYQKLILAPREKEAASQMFMAEKYFETDSLDKAINGDGNFMGFAEIVDEYGSTKSGNIAKYYLGICYLRKGQYEDAIEYLKEFSTSDELLAPLALGAIGDAYAELNQMDKAASYYAKAAAKNKNNFTTPLHLMKLGQAYENLNENKKALDAYQKIQTDFTDSQEARDIEKYIARVQAKL
jgi:tetratricopeptide (TPR) repeat protein